MLGELKHNVRKDQRLLGEKRSERGKGKSGFSKRVVRPIIFMIFSKYRPVIMVWLIF